VEYFATGEPGTAAILFRPMEAERDQLGLFLAGGDLRFTLACYTNSNAGIPQDYCGAA
jgi:hypothetical protein